MEDKQKIIEKVKKLFRLGTSPNQEEAQAAIAKANELLVKYNLKMQEAKEEVSENIRKDLFPDGKTPEWKVTLCNMMAKHYMVWLVANKKYGSSHKSYFIVGSAVNVELYFYSIDFLLSTYTSLCRQFMKKYLKETREAGFEVNKKFRKVARNSYCDGLNRGLYVTLIKQQKANDEKGLVIRRADVPPGEGYEKGKAKKSRGKQFDPMATMGGIDDGKKISINPGVKNERKETGVKLLK